MQVDNLPNHTLASIIDVIPTSILAIVLSKIQKGSIESYCLKMTCSDIKWLLEEHMHHPRRIDVRLEVSDGVMSHSHLPAMTPETIHALQCSALYYGHWDLFCYFYMLKSPEYLEQALFEIVILGGHLQCLKKLISFQFDNPKDVFMYTTPISTEIGATTDIALIPLAIMNGHLDIVKYLVGIGGNIRYDNNFAIIHAASYGRLDILQYIYSIIPHSILNCDRALSFAAEYGYLDIVMFLHSIGANVGACEEHPMYQSSRKGHLSIVKFLHSVGADIRADDDISIRRASGNGHLEVVKFLYSVGADVHAVNDQAVHSAAINGHSQVVAFLVSAGANRIATC